jgi:iron complex transport system substrate-binding protein
VTSSAIDVQATAGEIDARVKQLSADGEALFRLDEEMIRASRPDLVVTQALCEVCAVSEDDVRALARRLEPSPRILTLGATTLDAVLEEIQLVGAAIDLADEAIELVFGLRSRLRAVHQTLKAAQAPRPRVAVIEWTDPVYAAGHWAPDMIKRAGGVDVLATAGSHSTIRSVDEVRNTSPDVVVFAPCGCGLERAADEARALLNHADWDWARERAVWAMDGNTFLSRPSPRLVEGIEVVARLLNASLFSPLKEGRARRVS